MAKKEDCVFCKIVLSKIPAKVLGETDHALAFLDVNPVANGHTIIIPKDHYENLSSTPSATLNEVMQLTSSIAKKIMNSALDPWGINYLSNQGSVAGQEVFHFHMHVIPKYAQGEGFGFKTNKVNLEKIDVVYQQLQE